MDPLVPTKDPKEPITVTPEEIIYQRRVRTLAEAERLGDVTEACRRNGVSRTTYYQWRLRAERYGTEALWPKARRRPQLPNATPTHVVAELLAMTVAEPTIGARQYADRLAERGWSVGKTTVQNHLNDHGLGRRVQRVARAAAIAAATTGLVTEAAADDGGFGFCHFAASPGDLVAMDSFYVGKLKGVGPVYQLTAIDTATRWAVLALVIGPVSAAHTVRFVAQVIRALRRHGVGVRAVLSDNGPEWVASGFRAELARRAIEHHRTPPRSPNHNAVCERFHGTVLQECWRPAFHRRRFGTVRQLQAEADAWLVRYHHHRRNHSDFMRGRTPAQVLDSHRRNRAA